MPVGGEARGNAIAGFFGGPKLEAIERNKYLTDTINDQARGLRDLRGYGDVSAERYGALLDAATPQFNQINQDTINRLTGLADQYTGFDPMADREQIRGGDIGALSGFLEKEPTWLRRGDKILAAAGGYGGRPTGTYMDAFRTNNLTMASIPVLQSIFNNLGSNTAIVNQNRLANLAATLGLLDTRRRLPDAAAARSLLPYEARLSMLGREIPLSGQVAQATEANTAGYKQTQNKWANFFQQMGRSTDQLADTAMSLYTGGMMGGMGGFGGGGGSSAPAPQMTTFSMSPPQMQTGYLM